MLQHFARHGFTDEQIAAEIGITSKTLREWKKKYSSIGSALKRSKQVLLSDAEDTLQKLGIYGWKTTKTKSLYRLNEATGEMDLVEKQVSEEETPPNTTALFFFLQNRYPDLWRDTRQLAREREQSGVDAPRVTIIADFPREGERDE